MAQHKGEMRSEERHCCTDNPRKTQAAEEKLQSFHVPWKRKGHQNDSRGKEEAGETPPELAELSLIIFSTNKHKPQRFGSPPMGPLQAIPSWDSMFVSKMLPVFLVQ